MISAFLTGAAAGYAIAIPVGVIAVLILQTGLRRGFRVAWAAAVGAASADLIYATVAALFGTALANFVGPLARPLRALSVVVLVAIAVRGLLSLRNPGSSVRAQSMTRSARRTYVQLLGLTLLNPATVVYFAALILGLPALGREPGERLAFIAGVSLSSLSWQSLLAALGSLAHTRLSPRVQFIVSLSGNIVVLLFALVILIGLIES